MNDARCFELYSLQGMQRKDVAQVMGVAMKDVESSLKRYAKAQRIAEAKKTDIDRRISIHELIERRLFDKAYPDAPAEWWPVWLARSRVKQ
jgi:transposase